MFFSHDMSPECCWQIAVPPLAANLSETFLGASVCFLLTLGAALVYSSYTGEPFHQRLVGQVMPGSLDMQEALPAQQHVHNVLAM